MAQWKLTPARRAGLTTLLAVLALLAGALIAPRSRPAQAQTGGEPSLLQQLAERLLGARGPTPSGSPVLVQLLPGVLPSDLPLDLPLPDGSTLIGSAVAPSFAQFVNGPVSSLPAPSSTPTGEITDIVADAPGAPGDVLAFYESALTALGWTAPSANRPGPGGFLPPFLPQYFAEFCESARGPWMSVTVFPSTSGPNDLRLHVETGTPGPCYVPPGFPAPGLAPGGDLLPPLHPPPDVQVLPSGGSGGPGLFASDARATTTLSASDVEAFYEEQLVASGWTRIDGNDDGSLTWSTWSVPSSSGPSDWQGFLFVRNGPGDGELSLHVEVASPSQMGGGLQFGTATATVTATSGAVTVPAASPGSAGQSAGK